MADAVLASLVFAPIVLTYFLKSNAALSFLALCVGFVLSTSVVGDLKHLLSETNLSVTNDTLGIALITVPFLPTILLSRSAHKKGMFFLLQLIAALACGGLLVLSVGPLLSDTQANVFGSSFWTQLQKVQAPIIGAGALVSLMLIWAGNLKRPKKH